MKRHLCLFLVILLVLVSPLGVRVQDFFTYWVFN